MEQEPPGHATPTDRRISLSADTERGAAQILTTAQLVLDVPRIEDASQILAIAGDPRATVHNPSDHVADLPEARHLVDR